MFFTQSQASCTLEAGVKIYSMRVDSVHSEAYKVLGGITRAGHDDTGGYFHILHTELLLDLALVISASVSF